MTTVNYFLCFRLTLPSELFKDFWGWSFGTKSPNANSTPICIIPAVVTHPLKSCWRSLFSSWRRSCGSCSAAAAVSVGRRSPRPDELPRFTTKSPASDWSWARAFVAISRLWRRISLCQSREKSTPRTSMTQVAARQAGPATCSGSLCAGVKSKLTKPITCYARSFVDIRLMTSREKNNSYSPCDTVEKNHLIN